MNDEDKKTAAPPAATEPEKPAPIWGGFIIDILKKWLNFNQLTYGTKKKF